MDNVNFKRGDHVRLVDSVDPEYDTYLGLQIGITEGVITAFSHLTDDITMISVLWNNPRIEIPHWAHELTLEL